jgi:hypothetical protein
MWPWLLHLYAEGGSAQVGTSAAAERAQRAGRG